MPKRTASIRLTDEAQDLAGLGAKKLGISKSNFIELAIREKAERHRVTLPAKHETQQEVEAQ